MPSLCPAVAVAVTTAVIADHKLAESLWLGSEQRFSASSSISSTALQSTVILTLTLYVIALAFGPIIGGPLSELLGRRWVYVGCVFTGALFIIGAAEASNFVSLCVFRFLAGFCWGPTMAIAVGSCSELFRPEKRGPVSAIVVLMGFFGPGLGFVHLRPDCCVSSGS
jgi:MFS family permease